MRVLGLDGCRRGWAGVLLDADGTTEGVFLPTLAGIDDLEVAGVGIDVPIGLAPDHVRVADLAAKAMLGPRSSSVFLTPTRAAVAQETHAEASRVNRELTGKGISVQAHALRPKILEADAWVRSTAVRCWEVHPEVAFSLLLGAPASHPKRTWSGQRERRRALASAGVQLDDVGEVGGVATADDVLDAAAVAWSTRRLVAGQGESWPDPPVRYDDWPHPVAIFA